MKSALKRAFPSLIQSIRTLFPPETILSLLAGTAILAFGMVNIHRRVQITEGGILGMILLLNHWFGIPASLISPILDLICYAVGFRFLGKPFLIRSLAASACLAVFLRLWESLPFLLPDLGAHPLAAAVAGACFVGLGVGLVVRQSASSGGDDALALVISHLTGCRLSRAYLFTDLTVLTLSLSYIPLRRIAYSLVTVTVSSLLIDLVREWKLPGSEESEGSLS